MIMIFGIGIIPSLKWIESRPRCIRLLPPCSNLPPRRENISPRLQNRGLMRGKTHRPSMHILFLPFTMVIDVHVTIPRVLHNTVEKGLTSNHHSLVKRENFLFICLNNRSNENFSMRDKIFVLASYQKQSWYVSRQAFDWGNDDMGRIRDRTISRIVSRRISIGRMVGINYSKQIIID